MVKTRHMGIELLRPLAMLGIALQHVVMQGGVLYEAAVGDSIINYGLCYLLQSFSIWGSGVFAMVTGWLCGEKAPGFKSVVKIWLQCVFYMAAGSLLFWIFAPEHTKVLTWDMILLPLTNREYWYMSCYAIVVLTAPGLNAAVKSLGRKKSAGILLSLALVWGVMAPLFADIDTFTVNSGYSPWWLAYMYCLGTWFKLYGGERPVKRWLPFVGLAFGFIPGAVKAGEQVLLRFTQYEVPARYLGNLASRLQYQSSLPLMLVAVSIFLLFLGMDPKGCRKPIAFLSRHSLGVYLCHTQPVLFGAAYYIFAPLAHLSAPLMLLGILAASLAIFAASILVDFLRYLLFKLLRLDEAAEWISRKLQGVMERVLIHM